MTPHFIIYPQSFGILVIFTFLLLRPTKTICTLRPKRLKFWIHQFKVGLNKLSIGSGLDVKSVMYLEYHHILMYVQ